MGEVAGHGDEHLPAVALGDVAPGVVARASARCRPPAPRAPPRRRCTVGGAGPTTTRTPSTRGRDAPEGTRTTRGRTGSTRRGSGRSCSAAAVTPSNTACAGSTRSAARQSRSRPGGAAAATRTPRRGTRSTGLRRSSVLRPAARPSATVNGRAARWAGRTRRGCTGSTLAGAERGAGGVRAICGRPDARAGLWTTPRWARQGRQRRLLAPVLHIRRGAGVSRRARRRGGRRG